MSEKQLMLGSLICAVISTLCFAVSFTAYLVLK
jgi:hypothetical protein